MNIFKIPVQLLMNLDSLQIIFPRILRMQFSQDANIPADFRFRNAQQPFGIRADVICLVCFCIQHQENIVHIQRQLLEQLVPVQDFRVLLSQVQFASLNNQVGSKCGNPEHDSANQEDSVELQGVHADIDDVRLDKSQKNPVLDIRFFIDQIIIFSIQVCHQGTGLTSFKPCRKRKNLILGQIGMRSQNAKEIVCIFP